MALRPAPSGLRLSISSNMPGVAYLHVNVFNFAKRDSTPATGGDAAILLGDFVDNVLDEYRGMFYTDHQIFRMVCETISPEPREGSESSNLLAGTRVPDGDILPHFVTSKVSWFSGYLSRRFRGRSYFGGLRESDQSDGHEAPAHQNAVTAFIVAMMIRYGENAGTQGPYVFSILSDPDNVLPDSIGGIGQRDPQLAGVISNRTYGQLFSLRRRMVGQGM